MATAAGPVSVRARAHGTSTNAMPTPDTQRFEGTWRLIPARSRFQHGAPPSAGTYRIQKTDVGLEFTLDWTTAAGESQHAEFSLAFDVDEPASLELVDDSTLNTAIERSERVVEHATRRLNADATLMEIVQRGFDSRGRAFINRAFYERVKPS